MIIQGGRNRALAGNIVVADAIQFARGYAHLGVRLYHFQYLGSECACHPHLLYLICSFNRYGHAQLIDLTGKKYCLLPIE